MRVDLGHDGVAGSAWVGGGDVAAFGLLARETLLLLNRDQVVPLHGAAHLVLKQSIIVAKCCIKVFSVLSLVRL